MSQLQPVSGPPVLYSHTGIRVFGVIAIIIGCLVGCMATCLPLALLTGQPAAQSSKSIPVGIMIMGVLMYAGAAVVLIWTGVGTCQLRRWSRPILLTVMWPWLLAGISMLLMLPMQVRNMFATMETMPNQDAVPARSFMVIIVLVQALVVGLLGIVLPGAFIGFFQRRSVRAALEHYDPQPRWTDRCPTPVLSVSLFLMVGAAGILLFAATPAVPAFGRVIHQPWVAAMCVVLASVEAIVAWLCYRRRPIGWWGVLGWLCLMAANGILLALNPEQLVECYADMHMPSEQIEAMRRTGQFESSFFWLITCYWGVISLGFMIYLRRFFTGGEASSATVG